jgi:ribonuclease BN (tRNA processing enzyme)
MEITVLGSGTSVPHKTRTGSAIWIESGGGTLLLDCSPTAAHRMAEEGLDWANLDAVWISHFHLDHAGGLAPFLFGMKWAPETRGRRKPLTIFGPAGTKNWFDAIDAAGDYRLTEQPFPVEFVEVEPLERFGVFDGLSAVTLDTPHKTESRAIHLRDAFGNTFVFSSDTGFLKALGSFAMDVDNLLLECSFFKDKPVEGHLELSEAIYLARYSRAGKTVLTHFYPEWDDVDFEKEIELLDPAVEILRAFDGMRLSIDR